MNFRRVVLAIAVAAWLVVPCARAAEQQKKSPSAPDTITYEDVKDLATLEDGAYEGDGWYREYNYRSYSFVKRGSSVTGFAADRAGVWCFQGSFAGNVITISDAVNWDAEFDGNGRRTGRSIAVPLWDSQKSDFESVRMGKKLKTFPVRRNGPLTRSPSVIARDENWMAGCVGYYSGPREEPDEETFPCEDPMLRGTDRNDGPEPKYRESSPVCTITDGSQLVNGVSVRGGACSVENVFEVLVRTPSAIGPTLDDEQEVENCGVLNLAGSNRIRVEIDEAQHRVLNYTLPGHDFYPGRVIRQIVRVGDKVRVDTIGTGTLPQPMKAVNWLSAQGIWLVVDDQLRKAFAREHELDDDEE